MMKKAFSFLILIIFAGSIFGQKFHNQKIVGYVPDYGLNWVPDYSKVTHAIFGFLQVNRDGTIPIPTRYFTVPNRDKFLQRTNDAGVQRLIAISGDSLKLVCKNDLNINRLSDTLVKFCKYYGFNGVDIDWEGIDNSVDSNNYRKLMIALNHSLKPEGLDLVATVAFGSYWGPWYSDQALAQADWLQVMVYDQTGTWASSPFGNHSTMLHLRDAEDYWIGRGYTHDKLVMGVPFYGRKFKSKAGGIAPSYSYREIIAKFPYLCDSDNQTPGIDYNFFNGPALIREKCQYLIDNHFGGIMIWELTQDALGDNSLLSQIACTYSDNNCYIKSCDPIEMDGTALYFMDTTQKVKINPSNVDAFHFQNDFTIEAKVKASFQKGYSAIISNLNGNTNGLWGLWFGIYPNGALAMEVYEGTTSEYSLYGKTTYLIDGVWHDVAAVHRNDSIYLIVDGRIENKMKSPQIVYDQTPTTIGNDKFKNIFSGAIDEVKVWNVGRSIEDMVADKDECLNGNENNLVALYHFDEGKNSTELIDYSGNGNNGTFINIDPYAWVDGKRCRTINSVSEDKNSKGALFNIYPNPSNGKFVLALDKNYKDVSITVVDSYGKEVLYTHADNSTTLSIDMEGKQGVYFAIISTDGKKEMLKLLVE